MATNKISREILEFSNFSEYLCHADSNGVLRLWDSSSGVLRQEYVSKGHLSSRCHCLSWCPTITDHHVNETPKKKRKRSSTQQNSLGNLQLLAMGMSSGMIHLYSVRKGDLHQTLSGAHDECVMDMCWSQKGDRLFSCSRDGLVVCWDVEGACVESKWNAGPGLCSLHLCTSQKHLLTAGRTIQVWHLESKTLIQSFQGHTTDVLKMVEIPLKNKQVVNGGADNDDGVNDGVDDDDHKRQGIEGSYILSMAADENKISVRQVSETSKDLLASFSLPDLPTQLHLLHHAKQTLKMVVVTRGGSLAYFECHLNGRHRRPIKAKIVTTIVASDASGKGQGGKVLPMLTAKLLPGGGDETGDGVGGVVVCVSYADVLKPAFDRINVSDLKEVMLRQDPRSSRVSVEESVVKVKTPTVDNDVMLLTSSSLQVSRRDGADDVKPSRKRKKSFSQSQDEITLGDQLALMSKSTEVPHPTTSTTTTTSTLLPTTTTSTTTPLTASQNVIAAVSTTTTTSSAKVDSLAILLAQGLQSGDKKILNNVLQKTDYFLIRNTVAKLSSAHVHALVKELSKRISGHAQSGKSGIRWMKALLSIHSSYLSTVPDIMELLGPVLDHLEPSLEVLSKMMILKGKLDCMVAQFAMVSEPANRQATSSQAALSTLDPVDDEDDELMAEDVRHLEVSDEDEWEDETETGVSRTKDSKSSHKTSDFSDGEGSADDTLMDAD